MLHSIWIYLIEAVFRRCSVKKMLWKFLKKIHRKTLVPEFLFQNICGPRAWNFIIKETLTQMFSCEFWDNFINTYFYRTPLLAASGLRKYPLLQTTTRISQSKMGLILIAIKWKVSWFASNLKFTILKLAKKMS